MLERITLYSQCNQNEQESERQFKEIYWKTINKVTDKIIFSALKRLENTRTAKDFSQPRRPKLLAPRTKFDHSVQCMHPNLSFPPLFSHDIQNKDIYRICCHSRKKKRCSTALKFANRNRPGAILVFFFPHRAAQYEWYPGVESEMEVIHC